MGVAGGNVVRMAERRTSVRRRRGTSTREHQLLGLVVHGAQRGQLCVGDGMVTRGMGMQSRAGRKTKVEEYRSMMGGDASSVRDDVREGGDKALRGCARRCGA